MDLAEFRVNFNARLAEHVNNRALNTTLLPRVKYQSIIDELTVALAKTSGKSPGDYRKMKRFRLDTINGLTRLTTHPVNDIRDSIKTYVYTEELFDVLTEVHHRKGHLSRDAMLAELKSKYANITRDVVMLYLELCQAYHDQFPERPASKTSKNEQKNNNYMSAQFDLINCEANHDGHYKYILNYQEQESKFCVLRSLKDGSALTVAKKLLDIFTTIRIPTVLYSESGEDFCILVIAHLKVIWPELQILSGKGAKTIAHPNRDILSILSLVNQIEGTTNWSKNLNIVQYIKNTTYHCSLKKSPYEVVFSRKPLNDMKINYPNLPKEIRDDFDKARDEVDNSVLPIEVKVELNEDVDLS